MFQFESGFIPRTSSFYRSPKKLSVMTHDEKYVASRAIHARAREMRGSFLNQVACIEQKMATLFLDYFCRDCPDKRKLFFDGILTASFFGLRAKKTILVRILKQDYPRYWEREKQNFKAFDDVTDFRNRLAHCILDVSEDALARPVADGVAFLDRDDCTPITDRDFNDYEVKANMLHSCLLDIERLLPYKETPLNPQ